MVNRIPIPVIALAVLLVSIIHHGVAALGNLPPFRQELLSTVGAHERFGSSVVITPDGRRLAIGAESSGRIYVYDRNSSGFWDQSANLSVPGLPLDSEFGKTIGISSDGNVIVVGAPYYALPNTTYAGVVFIFRFNGSTWTSALMISEPSPISGALLCYTTLAVSYDGSTILCDRGGSLTSGFGVDVFFNNGATWSQQGPTILVPPYGNSTLGGAALSSNGSVLVFGAPYNNNSLGEVYVYARNGSGIWRESDLISAPPSSPTYFGFKVVISADASVIAVEANLATVFVLILSGQGYTVLQTINRPSGSTGGGFGQTAFVMSPSGNRIVIGDIYANYETSPVVIDKGGAFIFDRLLSLYNYTGQVYSNLIEPYSSSVGETGFGIALSLTEGNEILVGAPFTANGDGKRFVIGMNCD